MFWDISLRTNAAPRLLRRSSKSQGKHAGTTTAYQRHSSTVFLLLPTAGLDLEQSTYSPLTIVSLSLKSSVFSWRGLGK